MKPNDVIESYVADVMRRLPRKERNEIGLELRGLLADMLDERAGSEDRDADDAMVLAVLRDFGLPADVAARYRPPGVIIIPAAQTRSFAVLSVVGVVLQWALTLPRVFADLPVVTWWFTWGLGAFWWPGFLAMMALVATGIRQAGLFQPAWRPRMVDSERVDRGISAFGLLGCFVGAAIVTGLPWIAGWMPGPVARVFAFDGRFLHDRAPLVLLLWAGAFAVRMGVLVKGRWSPLTRRLDVVVSLAFVALLSWWLAAGSIFQAKSTNDGARAGIGLVVLFIVLDLALKLYRQGTRIRPSKIAG